MLKTDTEPVILEGLGAGSEPKHPQAEKRTKENHAEKGKNSNLKGGREGGGREGEG